MSAADPERKADLAALAKALAGAYSVVVSTGAGMSAESGVPTFRDVQDGLWARYRPEDLATPQAFEENPGRVWDWYEWRRTRLCGLTPHAGHRALAKLQAVHKSLTLVTQNVDGFHQQAGCSSVLELHGNIRRNRCTAAGHVSAWEPGTAGHPPSCPRCGNLLRPDVVWFGESLDSTVLEAACEAAGSCNVFLSIGTSTVVEPAASLGRIAAAGGALLAEINPEPTPLSPMSSYRFRQPAGEVLPALLPLVQQQVLP